MGSSPPSSALFGFPAPQWSHPKDSLGDNQGIVAPLSCSEFRAGASPWAWRAPFVSNSAGSEFQGCLILGFFSLLPLHNCSSSQFQLWEFPLLKPLTVELPSFFGVELLGWVGAGVWIRFLCFWQNLPHKETPGKEIPSPRSQIPDLALLRLRKKQTRKKKKWAEWKFKCCNPGGKTFYIISKKVHGRPSSCFYFILLFSGTVDDNFLNLQYSLILKYVLSLPSCPNCCFETTFSSQHQSHFRFKLWLCCCLGLLSLTLYWTVNFKKGVLSYTFSIFNFLRDVHFKIAN